MKKHFGIIGNPISHSLSPVLHQYWFKKYDIDADYSIIESTNEDLQSLIALSDMSIPTTDSVLSWRWI